MNELKVQLGNVLDLALVYIAEAHAEDEWPIGSQIKIPQHKTIEDRQRAAQACLEATGLTWPVLLDTDQFEVEYAPWPIRFYFFQRRDEGIYCDWISAPKEGGYYNWPEVERKLRVLVANSADVV